MNEYAKMIIIYITIIFALSAAGFWIYSELAPRYAKVDREVFEESKSYIHGKIQTLSNHYQEYNEKDSSQDREIIKNMVKIQFSDFKLEYINNKELKNFLKEMRGY